MDFDQPALTIKEQALATRLLLMQLEAVAREIAIGRGLTRQQTAEREQIYKMCCRIALRLASKNP